MTLNLDGLYYVKPKRFIYERFAQTPIIKSAPGFSACQWVAPTALSDCLTIVGKRWSSPPGLREAARPGITVPCECDPLVLDRLRCGALVPIPQKRSAQRFLAD